MRLTVLAMVCGLIACAPGSARSQTAFCDAHPNHWKCATPTPTPTPTPTATPAPTPSPDPAALWTGDFEEGTLADLTAGSGGGEYNSDTGDTIASQENAHTGSWGAKQTGADRARAGTRLFRWKELREHREITASAWIYQPTALTLTADPCCGQYFNLFQFKSRSSTGLNDPIWYVDLQNTVGGLKPTLVWWHRTLEGPHQGESGFRRYEPPVGTLIPVGRWFEIKGHLIQSGAFAGTVEFWLDGTLLWSLTGVRTGYQDCAGAYPDGCNEWAVNLYTDGATPAPVQFVDDMQITAP